MAEPLVKPRQLAGEWGCGLSTIYRLAELGVLPTVKIPGTKLIRFKRERIEQLVKTWEANGRRKRRKGQRADSQQTQP